MRTSGSALWSCGWPAPAAVVWPALAGATIRARERRLASNASCRPSDHKAQVHKAQVHKALPKAQVTKGCPALGSARQSALGVRADDGIGRPCPLTSLSPDITVP
jgi:hypothetical protein